MAQERNQSLVITTTFTLYIDDTTVMICIWVLLTFVCQLINIFGIITNIINIVCFVKQGFKDSTNISLLGLSCSDLASLVTTVLPCIFLCPGFDAADLPFEGKDVAYLGSTMPHFTFIRVGSCITAMITLDRCLSIAKPLQIKSIVTPQRTTVIIICIFVIFTFCTIPIYVVNKLGPKYSFLRNRTIIGLIYGENRDQVEKITLTINNFVIPLLSFVIITICTLILVFKLYKNNKWRGRNIIREEAEKVSIRNQKVAQMVVFISTLFIICLLPNSILLCAIAFESELFINGKYVKITLIFAIITYNLESINCSMNIFIYHHMSSKYRDTFNKLFIRRINEI